MSTQLVKYNAACLALAVASRVDEVKDIRDKAEAMRVYAKQAKNLDLERQAIEIRLRAERRTGELLIETQENGQRKARGGDRKSKSSKDTLIPALADLGISKKQSSDWQKMAAIPPSTFEDRIKIIADERGTATTAAVLREISPPKPPRTDDIQTAQRIQDECTKIGMNVQVSPARDIGKFNITYRNLSEAEIQQAIGDFKAVQQEEAVCN